MHSVTFICTMRDLRVSPSPLININRCISEPKRINPLTLLITFPLLFIISFPSDLRELYLEKLPFIMPMLIPSEKMLHVFQGGKICIYE